MGSLGGVEAGKLLIRIRGEQKLFSIKGESNDREMLCTGNPATEP